MQTTTNFLPSMHPYLPPRGSQALSTLHRGGLVLLPTANLWQVVTHPHYSTANERQFSLCPPSIHNRPELLFADLELLKSWVPDLHPKLENLLVYHKRAVTLLVHVPQAPGGMRDRNGLTAVRLIRDSFCYRLGEDLELPLVATLAQANGADLPPSHFGRIRSDILRNVDYVVKRRQKDFLGDDPTVVIRLDEMEEIEFVRE